MHIKAGGDVQGPRFDGSLVRMPTAWLYALLPMLDAAGKLSLLRTCTTFKEMLLQTQPVVLDMKLSSSGKKGYQQNLGLEQTVLKQASEVKLYVSQKENAISDDCLVLAHVLTSHMALLGRQLDNITSVHLKGVYLSQLIPSCLAYSCPSMKQLYLEDFEHYEHMDAIAPCNQLTSFHLKANLDCGEYGVFCKALTQAATVLPKLDTTTLDLAGLNAPGSALSALEPARQQITKLVFPRETAERIKVPELSRFTNLLCLELETTLNDSNMQELLHLPNLRQVSVAKADLRTIVNIACSWKLLHIREVPLASLAQLKLTGIQRIQLGCVLVSKPDNIETAATAWANMAKCSVCCPEVRVVQPSTQGQDLCNSLLGALHLASQLTSCTTLALNRCLGISPTFISSLARQLPANVATLSFQSCTAWEEGTFGVLLPSLPANVKTVSCNSFLVAEKALTDWQLAELCVAARRPVTLRLLGMHCLRPGWQQWLYNLMTAAGHRHVSLVVA